VRRAAWLLFVVGCAGSHPPISVVRDAHIEGNYLVVVRCQVYVQEDEFGVTGCTLEHQHLPVMTVGTPLAVRR